MILLLEENPQLLQLDILLISFQPQQKHLLHEPIHDNEAASQPLDPDAQDIVDIGGKVRDETFQDLAVILHEVDLGEGLQVREEFGERQGLLCFWG